MKTKNTYKQKMIERLKRWNEEIYLLDVEAENASEDAKLRYVAKLDVLHAKKREAAKMLKELETASGEAWEKAKITADDVWDDLRTGIVHAAYTFK